MAKPQEGSKWAQAMQKPESAPKPAAEPAVTTTAGGLALPVKKAATYRLPLDVHEILRTAIAEEAQRGNRLTLDAAVTDAIREWGKARSRRR